MPESNFKLDHRLEPAVRQWKCAGRAQCQK